jgi:predicted transcriptional regulator
MELVNYFLLCPGGYQPRLWRSSIMHEKLTDCEQLVMKVVWDAEDELSLMEVMDRVNDKYHKNWKPQTVSTFLARLVKKGYLRHYRQGRVFFYQILVPLEEYKGQITSDYVSFWNHDNADEFLCALSNERPLRQDEIERINKLINGLDE